MLSFIEVNLSAPPQYSVIWMHGLGADGHDFENIVPELQLSGAGRFIFPHAPERPVTINQGAVMRAWYDIERIDPNYQDEAGIRKANQQICELIQQEEQRGIDHIVLAGFSQGGSMALHTGLRYPKKLAGILALSSFLPLANTLEKEIAPQNKQIPILMTHGLFDPVVPIMFAKMSYEQIKSFNDNIIWKEYPMEHALCADEIKDIGQWLQKIF